MSGPRLDRGEPTAPQRQPNGSRTLAPSLTDDLAAVAVEPKAPFSMFHSVESRNGYWYAIRTILDSTGRMVSRDTSHELQRGAATDVCRSDMDRVACDMWHSCYGIEGQAEILRKDSTALRRTAREHIDKAAPIEKKIVNLKQSLLEAKGQAKSKPAATDVEGKVLFEGKLIAASEVPKHKQWQATAPQTRDADEKRIPVIEQQIAAEKAKLDQLLAVSSECERQADKLSIEAAAKASVAREAGDRVILSQKGRRLI